MTVLVDSSVWSLALRRHRSDLTPEQDLLRQELAELIQEGNARLIGCIRQELLSGVRSAMQFDLLQKQLATFDDVPVTTDNYVDAARASTRCRAAGVAGSTVDFLICAVAMKHEWPIFTTDRDFIAYARNLPIHLHESRRKFRP